MAYNYLVSTREEDQQYDDEFMNQENRDRLIAGLEKIIEDLKQDRIISLLLHTWAIPDNGTKEPREGYVSLGHKEFLHLGLRELQKDMEMKDELAQAMRELGGTAIPASLLTDPDAFVQQIIEHAPEGLKDELRKKGINIPTKH